MKDLLPYPLPMTVLLCHEIPLSKAPLCHKVLLPTLCHKKILTSGKEKAMLRRDPNDRERWFLERGPRWLPQITRQVLHICST